MALRQWAPRLSGGVVVAAVALSCAGSEIILSVNGTPDTLQVVSIDVTRGAAVLSQLNLVVGDTARLSAVTLNALSQPIGDSTITWASTQPGVASVDTAGVVVALAPGVTTISAAVGSVSASVPTNVTAGGGGPPPAPAMGTLDITEAEVTLTAIGAQRQLTVVARDSAGAIFSPPLTWGTTNAQVATVSAGRATAVNFGSAFATVASACCTRDSARIIVRDPGASTTLDWFCDWRLGTNATQAHLRGTNSTGAGLTECFGEFTTTPPLLFEFLDVIPVPSGQAFPPEMQNVLRITMGDYPTLLGSPMLKINEAIREPAIGEYIFYRTYDLNGEQPGDGNNIHVLHVGTQDRDSSPYGMRWFRSGPVQSDSTFFMSIDPNFQTGNRGRGQGRFLNNANVGPPQVPFGNKVNRVYRREWRIHRFHADSARFAVRVYDDRGTLVMTNANYRCTGSEANGCFNGSNWLVDSLGAQPVAILNWSKVRGLELGNNGSTPDDPTTRRYWYWGGLAIRVSGNPDDWIGPYPVGREAN